MCDPLTTASIVSLLVMVSVKVILSVAKRIKNSSCMGGAVEMTFTDKKDSSSSSTSSSSSDKKD
jgi:hypothetical protein